MTFYSTFLTFISLDNGVYYTIIETVEDDMTDQQDIPTSRWYPRQDDDIDRDEYEHDLSGTLALMYPQDKGESK